MPLLANLLILLATLESRMRGIAGLASPAGVACWEVLAGNSGKPRKSSCAQLLGIYLRPTPGQADPLVNPPLGLLDAPGHACSTVSLIC